MAGGRRKVALFAEGLPTDLLSYDSSADEGKVPIKSALKKEKPVVEEVKSLQISRSSSMVMQSEKSLLDILETTEKKPSELEPELLIQAKRIYAILDKAIQRIKLVACLTKLFDEESINIRDFITDEAEADFVLEVIFSTGRQTHLMTKASFATNISNVLEKISFFTLEDAQKKSAERFIDRKFDITMSQTMDILFKYKAIQEFVEENYSESTCDHSVVKFINCFQKLRELAEDRLSITSREDFAREKELRLAYRSNIILRKKIEDLEQQLEKQSTELGSELAKKVEMIESYREKIEEAKAKFAEDIKKRVHESEKRMTQETVNSESRQEELKEDSETMTERYKLMLEEHLAEEKNMRAKRLKVESQLASWLSKYDGEVGERQHEYESIKAEYDKEKEEMDALQELIDDQDEEYTILMAEKAEEELRIYNELCFKLLRSRSARIIQRSWRAYRERKLARKRGRRGKKKGAKAKREGKSKKDVKVDVRKDDPNAVLAGAFKGDILEDINVEDNAFN